MVTTSVNLPSINIPFVDKQGRLSPIWHEFLRSFVAGSVAGTIVPPAAAHQVVAGNGLVGGGPISSDVPLRVGQGSGLVVNADDISVDIHSATYALGTLEDEILFSDVSDNNQIKRTKLSDVAGLSSPGGLDTYIQYNSSGSFAGNSGFTYDGVNTLSLGGVITINGSTFTTANNAGTNPFTFNVPGGSTASHFIFTQNTGSSDMPLELGSLAGSTDLVINSNRSAGAGTTQESRIKFQNKSVTKWTMGLEGSGSGSKFVFSVTGLNVGSVYNIDPTNSFFNIQTALVRLSVTGITASITQTQGQGALTGEINEISVCANINDTVTLPIAKVAGRHCTVMNHGAQTLKVFPASGGDLGAGLNTSTTIAAASRKVFIAYSATKWEPVI